MTQKQKVTSVCFVWVSDENMINICKSFHYWVGVCDSCVDHLPLLTCLLQLLMLVVIHTLFGCVVCCVSDALLLLTANKRLSGIVKRVKRKSGV